MMDNVLGAALRYAAVGFSVLPLHRPVERNGRCMCSCGKVDCKSPAKHPVGKLASRGLLEVQGSGIKLPEGAVAR